MGIRRAVEGDLAIIHPLLEQFMPEPAGLRRVMWEEALRNKDYAAWIDDVDGRPAGFLDLFIFPDLAHGGNIGLIGNLVIDEQFRGRGLGEGLLRAATEHCRHRDVVELHVWTDFDNAPAIGLYRKVGFVDRALLLELEFRKGAPHDG